jgi:hypothetical protein
MSKPPGEHRDEQEREEFAKHADDEPHHALNNPATDPDETEWPDPYEKRPDPRDDAPAPAPPSTSEPHPERNTDDGRHERAGDHNDG